MLLKIPGNAPEDFRECSRRCRGIFQRVPENVRKDSGECSRRIPGNLSFDLFLEISLVF